MAENKKYEDPIIAQLRQLRLDQSIKQREVAELLEIGASVLGAYENQAVSPQLKTVHRWADVFGMRVELTPTGARAEVKKLVTVRSDPNTLSVELSQYHVALAMGMLIVAAQNGSGKMADDLQEIADALARALSS